MLFTTTFTFSSAEVIALGKKLRPKLAPEEVLGTATVIVNEWIREIVQRELKEVLGADTK